MRKAGLVMVAALLAILAWAWWDGGEQSLEPIVQPVNLPEGWQ